MNTYRAIEQGTQGNPQQIIYLLHLVTCRAFTSRPSRESKVPTKPLFQRTHHAARTSIQITDCFSLEAQLHHGRGLSCSLIRILYSLQPAAFAVIKSDTMRDITDRRAALRRQAHARRLQTMASCAEVGGGRGAGT